MSKIEELQRTFRKAFIEAKGSTISAERAGIAAVVRALRPKLVLWFHAIDQNVTEKTAAKFADDFINEILGAAGDEKVAGGSSSNADKATEAGGARCATTCASAPATDPAPDVCEWRDDAYIGCFTTSCSDDAAWNRLGGTPKDEGYNFCPSCGKPIKFTEAKT